MKTQLGPICIAFGILTLTISCAEDAFVSYDNIKPKLVVQSRLSPDTTFQIQIYSNLSPVDDGQYIIPDDLNVSLISSTGSVVNLYRENDVYIDPHSYPQEGQSYYLLVQAPGFESVESVTSIPKPVELALNGSIQNLRVEQSDVSPDKMNVTYDLRLNFVPHEHEYFHFSFIQTTSINTGTINEPKIEERAYYIDPQFPAEDGFYAHHEAGVLIDAMKTQTSNALEFSFVDYTLVDVEELGNLFIEVRTVTPEYYNYFTSLARQLISRDDPFAEPIPVFNNIKDGAGNFSGFSRRLYQIPIIP